MDKRADIKVGFRCNNNCLFCVQAHKRGLGDKRTEEIKRDLDAARKTGCSGVVFTGGEPTLRKDIEELVAYARKAGFGTIQIQTNGRMLSYMGLCRRLAAAGANEFSPALHGHEESLHDSLTRSPGSFRQTVGGIRNLKRLGLTVVTNTVVTEQNYRHLPDIARLLVGLGVDQFQFAFIHPVGNAYENFDSVVPRMSEAAPYIHEGLRIGMDAGKTVMAEAMPYCMMRGFEKQVAERSIPPTEIRDAGFFIPDYGKERKGSGKAKFPQCAKCAWDGVCEGPWKEYPERFGSGEFVPVESREKGRESVEERKEERGCHGAEG